MQDTARLEIHNRFMELILQVLGLPKLIKNCTRGL